MGRITSYDIVTIWTIIFTLAFLFTSSFKYSLVVSVFGVVNVFILVYWFAVVPPDRVVFKNFVNPMKIGAHRGLSDDAPENTLAAFRLSKQMGADTVEFDLEFTEDGVPIVIHDDTVDRTTDGSGPVSKFTYAKINKLNAAAKFAQRGKFGEEKIPTLTDTIRVLIELNVMIIIDVKIKHPEVIKTLLNLYRSNPVLYERAAVCSFFPNIVYEVKRSDPSIMTGHTWRPGFFAFSDIGLKVKRYSDSLPQHYAAVMLDHLHVWALHSWMWKITGASLVLTQTREISANYVSRWKQRGLQVMAWTSNTVPERLYYLNHLSIPFLSDRLSDFQDQIKDYRQSERAVRSEETAADSNNVGEES